MASNPTSASLGVIEEATAKAAPPGSRKYHTYDELAAILPESNCPTELWDGELTMSPSPSFYHQEIVARFYEGLARWVRQHHLGKVVVSPIDMVLSPSWCVQPDVAFISNARLSIVQRVIRGAADLVAEVISEGERQRDRMDKRALYEQHGVQEYWIIDPEPRTVDVLRMENNQYRLVGLWRDGEVASSDLLAGFTASTTVLFTGEVL
ncbi:MAG: Uma2 family endonuclease [Verrucomicrobia bacterium]|nr:Uma2 family endonuclease [Verrucomicrobiota bacterium]